MSDRTLTVVSLAAGFAIPFIIDVTVLQLAIAFAAFALLVLCASVWLAAHDARNYHGGNR